MSVLTEIFRQNWSTDMCFFMHLLTCLCMIEKRTEGYTSFIKVKQYIWDQVLLYQLGSLLNFIIQVYCKIWSKISFIMQRMLVVSVHFLIDTPNYELEFE